ncbi:hypothetical protein T06_8629 [Trichinella sp. T6]|nr:hypothetical protein T06_13246 [Trichinella sp. T6]KRX84016.1 hypothetical protein T06_8629 [Trichinella sp. T6]
MLMIIFSSSSAVCSEMSLAVLTDGVLRRRSLTCRGIPSTSTAWSETTSVTVPFWCRVSHVAPSGLTLTESPTANRPFFSSGSSVARSTPRTLTAYACTTLAGAVHGLRPSRGVTLYKYTVSSTVQFFCSVDLHASIASLRYAISGRSVGTSVPHSDYPPGDELRKGPSSESGVVVR